MIDPPACVSCMIPRHDCVEVLIRSHPGHPVWSGKRMLCRTCRDLPETKGYWKYPDKAAARANPACPDCKHIQVGHGSFGCSVSTPGLNGRPTPCGCSNQFNIALTLEE